MTSTVHDIYGELQWRGLVHQCTEETQLRTWLNGGSRSVYAGFDPTADSLHVGSLLPLLMLRRFQKAGHRPIAVAGGATGMIGDPSGKSKERNLLTPEQLQHNLAGVRRQMEMLLDFDGANAAVIVDNLDWMKEFSFIEFLRDIGKNAPMSVMLAKDSVKTRLSSDAGLSYTEFSYQLLQAYDFAHLGREMDCRLQVGGSDQWGNIVAGVDLARRMHGMELFGLTCPLLTKADGSKMGKTESGAIWLSPEKTSPYLFFQYWLNLADEDAGKCLRFLTELPRDEIESLDKARTESPHERASQRRLAESLTEMLHGPQGLQSARRATDVLFGGAEVADLSDAQILEIFADVPNTSLPIAQLADGIPLIDALVASQLCKSKGEARRVIQQGGAYVNNRRIGEVEATLTRQHLASESTMVLRQGKKKYALLRFGE